MARLKRGVRLIFFMAHVRVRVRVHPHAFSSLLIRQRDQHIESIRCRNEEATVGHVTVRRTKSRDAVADIKITLRAFVCHSSLRHALHKKDS